MPGEFVPTAGLIACHQVADGYGDRNAVTHKAYPCLNIITLVPDTHVLRTIYRHVETSCGADDDRGEDED